MQLCLIKFQIYVIVDLSILVVGYWTVTNRSLYYVNGVADFRNLFFVQKAKSFFCCRTSQVVANFGMTWNPLSVMFSLVVDINFRMVLRRTLFSVNVLQRDRLPVQMWVEMITLFILKSIDDQSLLQSHLPTDN